MPGPQLAGGPPSGPPSGPPQIPPGVPPAFFIPPSDGDVDKGPTVLGVTWAFAALSLIFFALRVYSRRVLTRNLGIEDGIMLIALVRTCFALEPFGPYSQYLRPSSSPKVP